MVMPFDHKRHENVGEHSFSLAVYAAALAEQVDPSLDVGQVVQYALVHDIVEIHAGDVTVWESEEALRSKAKDEKLAAKRIAEDFPHSLWLAQTYQEFELQDTPEKRFVYALDKLYPHVLIIHGDYHPVHPSWEAYLQTEQVACKKVATYPKLEPLFNELCMEFRRRPHFFSSPIPPAELRKAEKQ